jgi:V-type H+-transporting ATPase subunit a
MTLALCLQVPNHIRFKRPIDIYTNFIPQMIFLQSIFGYLVVCILYKWSIDWSTTDVLPPSLLNMLISMFLAPGKIEQGKQLYRGQGTVQLILLVCAGLCVPALLVGKPYYVWRQKKGRENAGYVGISHAEEEDGLLGEQAEDGNGVTDDTHEEDESVCALTDYD